jgi:hypothetical protein
MHELGIQGNTNDEIVKRLHRFANWWGAPGVAQDYETPATPRLIPPVLHWATTMMNVSFSYGSFDAVEHEGRVGCFSDCGNTFSASIEANGENPLVQFDEGQTQPYFPKTINDLVIGAYFETIASEAVGLPAWRVMQRGDSNVSNALLDDCTEEHLIWKGSYFSSGAELLSVWLSIDVLLIELAHGENSVPSIQAVHRSTTGIGKSWIEAVRLQLGLSGAYTQVLLRQENSSEVEGLTSRTQGSRIPDPESNTIAIQGRLQNSLNGIFETSKVLPWREGLMFSLEDNAPIEVEYSPVQRANTTVVVQWDEVSDLWNVVVDSCVIDSNPREEKNKNQLIFFYRGSGFAHYMLCTDGTAFEELQKFVIAAASGGVGKA